MLSNVDTQRIVESWYLRASEIFPNDYQTIFRYATNKIEFNVDKYHSTYHCMLVALIADEILCEEFIPTLLERKKLFYAATYHDFDHTYGNRTDDVNIHRAIIGASNGISYVFPHRSAIDDVYSCIACTEYPFIREPKNEIEKCIRDADLLMCTTKYAKQFHEMMQSEMGKKFSFEENVKWVKSQHFFTHAGRMMIDSI